MERIYVKSEVFIIYGLIKIYYINNDVIHSEEKSFRIFVLKLHSLLAGIQSW